MLAKKNPERSTVIRDHQQAQAFIQDWLTRWRHEHRAERAMADVTFKQHVARCSVKVDCGFGAKNNHTMLQYDLSRPETEDLLHNALCAAVEPKEAWKARETRWKGAI